ncbi:MAG: tetrathionate reductase family octaheme c-type cytochrome [Rhodospirillaceae bacterium]|nr:tetrathionate reductase family octaheme c-type cytochrome [Rhodospirillales bacterium]MBT3904362.1 tetrathionate reductase family octaheme c-type cytochrome [Rhodospirillaceae bacterium]MBT4701021.1 tetrathionate reductase family octaheme c-type cytochrome [Rhodospirillaceae bacterium]MBT5033642.1 tetrathionate reductase family octaheme c-type cytochrome [Rhodospirillaceae bacterium]MBT6221521.1 tetrathionate reductase family octaheme c-type cytochrome [Rhodospirillaceae bacterium]
MPDLSQPKVIRSTADHSKFEILKKKFRKSRDITKACLSCHNVSAKQIHKTKHWNWEFTHTKTGQKLGARNIINTFFGGTASNEASCSHCHIGSGWKGNKFDYKREENVDCLICHDTTGKYAFKKFHTARGNCGVCHEEIPESPGKKKHKTDLNEVALNVGPTSRRTCGSCHFLGGGGINVKHGDLDSSLTRPSYDLDVHMDADGLNFTCTSCHSTDQHAVRGSRYENEINDIGGRTIPGKAAARRSSCASCHGERPMKNDKLNDHTDKVACQTCHIPSIARGGHATKMRWDWSTSGKLDANGKPFLKKDKKGNVIYSTQKGDSVWAENVVPDYIWSDRTAKYTLLGDKIDPSKTVAINTFMGSADKSLSRISPVKKSRGKQPYDAGNNRLVAVNLFALHRFAKDKSAYWRNLDWPRAIAKGMKAAGKEFSGKVGFVETEMLWPVTHMVAPADKALGCDECHSKNGRLENINGIYIPSRDTKPVLEWLGLGMFLISLFGVMIHTMMRILTRNRRNNGGVKP